MKNRQSTIRVLDLMREATDTVLQRPVRTLLTGLGTALGVGAFIVTVGFAETTRAQVSSHFDALKATEIRLRPVDDSAKDVLPSDSSSRLAQLNGVVRGGLVASINAGRTMTVSTGPGTQSTNDRGIRVIAMQPGALGASLVRTSSGRLFDEFHERSRSRVVLLGRVAAGQLGISSVVNQPTVFIGTVGFAVIGIIENAERNPDILLSVVIPFNDVELLPSATVADSEVIIETKPGAAQLIGRQAALAVRPDKPELVQVLVPPDPTTLRRQVSKDVTSMFLVLSVLSLIIGAVAITNATLMSVIQRTEEVGLRRSMGAKRSHIAFQICVESAVIGMIGSGVGLTFALVTLGSISAAREWALTIDSRVLGLAPFVGLVVGAASGVLPALRASRTEPAIALRT